MADGTGAGQLQPALAGSAVVGGDPKQLIAVILHGPAAVLPADRPKYSNIMPAFNLLTDQQVSELTTYIRQRFANGAAPISAAQVAPVRSK